MKDKVRNYFDDLEFRFTVYPDRIHIINYSKILSLENDRVSILLNKKRIIFKGNNFALNKLLDDEVLIFGEVNGVEINDI